MIPDIGTLSEKEFSRIDGAVSGNEDAAGHDVLAAGAAHPQNLPGVVDLDIAARHHGMNSWSPCRRVRATQHHPLRIIYAAAKLPSPFDAIAPVDRKRDALP